jgi:hypothetical protein
LKRRSHGLLAVVWRRRLEFRSESESEIVVRSERRRREKRRGRRWEGCTAARSTWLNVLCVCLRVCVANVTSLGPSDLLGK